jgi:hypothetical protein
MSSGNAGTISMTFDLCFDVIRKDIVETVDATVQARRERGTSYDNPGGETVGLEEL